jgi:hypothetical protein
MHGETLTLQCDEDDRVVWLLHCGGGLVRDRRSIWLRETFDVQDVRDAILATPWVSCDDADDALVLLPGARCETIRDVVQQMLGYFDAPGVPSPQLIDIKSAVQRFHGETAPEQNLSWYAYAWLDVMVRDDIADQARSAEGIWTLGETVVDVLPHFRRRIEQLFSWSSQPVTHMSAVRMAGSVSTRAAHSGRDAKSG